EFNNIGGQRIDRLAALDIVTGKLDPGFNPPTPTAHVNVILPANGRVYFGGAWKATPGTPVQPELGALNEDGTPDTTFVAPQDFGGAYVTHGGSRDEAADNLAIQALAVTGDGNTLMVGGNFLHLGKAPGDPTYDYQNHGGPRALHPQDRRHRFQLPSQRAGPPPPGRLRPQRGDRPRLRRPGQYARGSRRRRRRPPRPLRRRQLHRSRRPGGNTTPVPERLRPVPRRL